MTVLLIPVELQLDSFERDMMLSIANIYGTHVQALKAQVNNEPVEAERLINESLTASQDLLDDYNVGILTVMTKRDLLLKNQFNLEFNFIEDFDLIFRLSFQTKFHFIKLPTSYYRLHEKNLSKVKLDKFVNELKKWINSNSNKLKNKLSFQNLKTRVKLMEIKNDILKGKKLKALSKMINLNLYKNYSTRLKLFLTLFLPTFLLKKY